jgi:uncharacterized protein with NRDE domain
MCTLIALHRTIPGVTLLVAANRDEFLDRPAEGPTLWRTASGPIVAPRDLTAGGTWLGLNARGVFAAVTNVSCVEPDSSRRSRGLLVLDTLAASSACEAAEKIHSLPLGTYNPFNLFVADAHDALAFTYQDAVRPAAARDGVFVIGNAPLDATEPTKLSRTRERLAGLVSRGAEVTLDGAEVTLDGAEVTLDGTDVALDELGDLCQNHEPGPRGALDALCVHAPSYGTRSSALLRIGEDGLEDSRSAFRFADGPPCENRYVDHTPLLRDLDQGCPGVEGS